jgi:hypothetical protein
MNPSLGGQVTTSAAGTFLLPSITKLTPEREPSVAGLAELDFTLDDLDRRRLLSSLPYGEWRDALPWESNGMGCKGAYSGGPGAAYLGNC